MAPQLNRLTIDDWDLPRFSAQALESLKAIAASAPGVHIEPGAILDAAAQQTGLSDFGDPGFHEPLSVLCDSLLKDFRLSPAGTVIAFSSLVRYAANRLRLTDLFTRCPEVGDVEVARPIFVVGLPRTGTSHLSNLMSADPALRCARYWESLEPVLSDPQPASEDQDPRHARAAEAWALTDMVLPHMKALHEMDPGHMHEDIELMGPSFSSSCFEGMLGPVRTYTEWYRATDQTPAYRYLKQVLQAMQWLRGGQRWVLKTPAHLENLNALNTVFPDAVCIFTHRDPVTITASCATMETYLARLTVDCPDPRAVGQYWVQRSEDFIRACVRDRDIIPASRSVDIGFDDFMADDIAAVERIYDLADQPFTATTRSAMTSYMAEHPRGKYGAVNYDLTVFGAHANERRAALQFYVDRFGLAVES